MRSFFLLLAVGVAAATLSVYDSTIALNPEPRSVRTGSHHSAQQDIEFYTVHTHKKHLIHLGRIAEVQRWSCDGAAQEVMAVHFDTPAAAERFSTHLEASATTREGSIVVAPPHDDCSLILRHVDQHRVEGNSVELKTRSAAYQEIFADADINVRHSPRMPEKTSVSVLDDEVPQHMAAGARKPLGIGSSISHAIHHATHDAHHAAHDVKHDTKSGIHDATHIAKHTVKDAEQMESDMQKQAEDIGKGVVEFAKKIKDWKGELDMEVSSDKFEISFNYDKHKKKAEHSITLSSGTHKFGHHHVKGEIECENCWGLIKTDVKLKFKIGDFKISEVESYFQGDGEVYMEVKAEASDKWEKENSIKIGCLYPVEDMVIELGDIPFVFDVSVCAEVKTVFEIEVEGEIKAVAEGKVSMTEGLEYDGHWKRKHSFDFQPSATASYTQDITAGLKIGPQITLGLTVDKLAEVDVVIYPYVNPEFTVSESVTSGKMANDTIAKTCASETAQQKGKNFQTILLFDLGVGVEVSLGGSLGIHTDFGFSLDAYKFPSLKIYENEWEVYHKCFYLNKLLPKIESLAVVDKELKDASEAPTGFEEIPQYNYLQTGMRFNSHEWNFGTTVDVNRRENSLKQHVVVSVTDRTDSRNFKAFMTMTGGNTEKLCSHGFEYKVEKLEANYFRFTRTHNEKKDWIQCDDKQHESDVSTKLQNFLVTSHDDLSSLHWEQGDVTLKLARFDTTCSSKKEHSCFGTCKWDAMREQCITTDRQMHCWDHTTSCAERPVAWECHGDCMWENDKCTELPQCDIPHPRHCLGIKAGKQIYREEFSGKKCGDNGVCVSADCVAL